MIEVITPMSKERVQDLCKNSLYFLCKEILQFNDWDHCHDDMEKMLTRPSGKKLLQFPRGHLKSSIAKGFIIQKLLKDPDHRVLLASQIWDRARDMLFEIKGYLTDKSELPKIFGDFRSSRWREDDIVIAQRTKALAAASVATAGVESELTSAHYDLIIADDLCGLTNTQTKEQREKTKKFRKFLNTLLDPGSIELDIGTRWHFDDYYNDIITKEQEFYDVMVRKVVEKGKIIFPKKFSKKFNKETKQFESVDPKDGQCFDYINFLKQSMGSDFHSQYMNNPVDAEHQMFKREYFQYFQRPPKAVFKAMTVDPAISFKESSDFTAIVTCGMTEEGQIFVIDYIQGHWGSLSEIVDRIFERAERFNPQIIGIEANTWQKSLKFWADKKMRDSNIKFPLTELKPRANEKKELRIKALEPYYKNKMVFHAPWMKDLEDQLLAFSPDGYKAAHDDLIDALAYQLELLVPGPEAAGVTAPVGSWEWEFEEATRANQQYKEFFHE